MQTFIQPISTITKAGILDYPVQIKEWYRCSWLLNVEIIECKMKTYWGHPSNVDTVNNVNIAMLTSSKLKLLFVHSRVLISG